MNGTIPMGSNRGEKERGSGNERRKKKMIKTWRRYIELEGKVITKRGGGQNISENIGTGGRS